VVWLKTPFLRPDFSSVEQTAMYEINKFLTLDEE